jgi:hypothetical protein
MARINGYVRVPADSDGKYVGQRSRSVDPGDGTKTIHVQLVELATAEAIVAGQQAATTSAAALPTQAVRQVVLRALQENDGPVFIGPAGVTTSTGFPLYPGDPPLRVHVENANQVYIVAAAAGPAVAFLGEA